MKTILTFLTAILFFAYTVPVSLVAQPIVNNNKFTDMVGSSAESMPNVKDEAIRFTAWFDDNTLQLTGNFDPNKSYEVIVYDMIGSKIFTRQFTGYDQSKRFDMDRQVQPGIYIVSIAQTNEPSSRQIIKIVKH